MNKNKANESLFKWVGPIFNEEVFYFRKKGSNVWMSNGRPIKNGKPADKEVVILVVKSSYDHQLLRKPNLNLFLTTRPTESLQMLNDGTGELMVMGKTALSVHARSVNIPVNHFEPTFTNTEGYLYRNEFYIAFSKDSPNRVIAHWQEALDQVKANTRYDEMTAEYWYPDFP